MPKMHTFPTLFDGVNQMNITKLKKWGYLEEGRFKAGTLIWSRNGEEVASICILVDLMEEEPYVQLSYNYKEIKRKYKIYLVSRPSNLGVGKLWYFVCPVTKKRCRKLYCIGGYFLHREAFNGCMYESQTHSKYYRQLEKDFGAYFTSEKAYEEIYSKHFKKYYNGKPTKRYKRLLQKIEDAEKVDMRALERMF